MSARYPWGGSGYGGINARSDHYDPSLIDVPGFDSSFLWVSSAAGAPFTSGTWGGARPMARPSAGLMAQPDPESGVITLAAWWAYASAVVIDRITPDGERTRVRAADPEKISGATHVNRCINPSARDNLDGIAPTNASSAVTRLSGLTEPPRGTAASFTVPDPGDPSLGTDAFGTDAFGGVADGVFGVSFTEDVVDPGTCYYSLYYRVSSLPSSAQLQVQYFDVRDQPTTQQTIPLSDVQLSSAVGSFQRLDVTTSKQSGRTSYGLVSLIVAGMPVGATLDVTARLLTDTPGLPYFDGDTYGGSWMGTPGDSSSTLSPVGLVTDAEAPQDVPLLYELRNPDVAGYQVRTGESVTLSSDGNRSWMSHPANPFRPVPAWILGPFGPLKRSIVQGVYYPLDSDDGLPIVRTQSSRQGRQGTVKFLALDHGERDRLLRMFQDGSPVLIRPPATYGEGSAIWMSLGEITEDQPTYYSEHPYRTLSADWYEVARPLVANQRVTV